MGYQLHGGVACVNGLNVYAVSNKTMFNNN